MKLTLLAFLVFVFSSCVSSLFKENVPVFSDEIKLSDPGHPFKDQSLKSHKVWKNTENQNIILMNSDCGESHFSVNNAYQNLTDSLSNLKVSDEKSITFNKVKGYSRTLTGLIDETPIAIETFSFKHKNCIYLSALSGKPDSVPTNKDLWYQFLKQIDFVK